MVYRCRKGVDQIGTVVASFPPACGRPALAEAGLLSSRGAVRRRGDLELAESRLLRCARNDHRAKPTQLRTPRFLVRSLARRSNPEWTMLGAAGDCFPPQRLAGPAARGRNDYGTGFSRRSSVWLAG